MHREWTSYFEPTHYRAIRPAVQGGIEQERHPIVIVGGGAVGLCVALGLARHRVRSVVIEADDTVCTGSRAVCISRRSLEILAGFGVAQAFTDLGLAWTGGRSYYREREVFQLAMPHNADQKFPPMLNLQQCFTEKFLVDAATRHRDLIEIRWQSRVTAIAQAVDSVRIEIATDDGAYAMNAAWVVACDGARSQVRKALDLRLQGTQYEGAYVIVDIELKSDYPAERRAWFDPPSNPGSTLLMHKQPLDIWRLDYQLRDDENPDDAIKPENVIPRITSHLRMIGEREDWKLVWISLYRANALTLESYRHGHVLFAGDAAHLVPIFGVRGLNSGIEDANNLAWKLASVVKAQASAKLLDSYSSERVFAARENLRYASKSTEFMAPPTRGFGLMRDAVLALAADHPWLRSLLNPRQTSAIGFPDSTLNGPEQGHWVGGPRPGDPLPECRVTSIFEGQTTHGFVSELVAAGFTMLHFCTVVDDRPATHWLAWHRIPRQDPMSVRAFEMFDAAPTAYYLVRPDGHVLARWRDVGLHEIEALLATTMGGSDDGPRSR